MTFRSCKLYIVLSSTYLLFIYLQSYTFYKAVHKIYKWEADRDPLRDPFTLFKLFVPIIFIVRDFLCFHLTDCKNLSKIYHITKQSKSK